jgi:hypothetical protein
VIARHGLFMEFYTARGSHDFHTPEAGGKVSKTQLTQVGRALKQRGIGHIAAYSPEARGRCERAFRTLQDRLPKELALAGIITIAAANRFLRAVYLPEHNARFAVPAEAPAAAFVQVPEALWRDVLCLQEERRVGNDNCVRWHGRSLQIPPTPLRPHLAPATVRVHHYPTVRLPSSRARTGWPASRKPRRRATRTWPRDHRDAASPVAFVDNAPRLPTTPQGPQQRSTHALPVADKTTRSLNHRLSGADGLSAAPGSGRAGCMLHVGHTSGSSLVHRLVGPAAGAVEHAQDFDAIGLDAVGHEVGAAPG